MLLLMLEQDVSSVVTISEMSRHGDQLVTTCHIMRFGSPISRWVLS